MPVTVAREQASKSANSLKGRRSFFSRMDRIKYWGGVSYASLSVFPWNCFSRLSKVSINPNISGIEPVEYGISEMLIKYASIGGFPLNN